jgi:large subunit ribosomal protein L13
MKTAMANKESATQKRKWFIVDADGKVLGRVASQVASVLRGKHKADYTPHVDGGDFVVIINAGKVRLTGKKLTEKKYYHHTGWQGHIEEETAETLRARKPEQLITIAVKGMLPTTTLGRHMLKKLKVYPGGDHPHAAQRPETLDVR